MSHFEGKNHYESVDEWEIRELILPNGNKFIGVYIKTSAGEKRYALGGDAPLAWIEALIAATKAHPQKVTVSLQ